MVGDAGWAGRMAGLWLEQKNRTEMLTVDKQLLKTLGLRVTSIKIDPYLSVSELSLVPHHLCET